MSDRVAVMREGRILQVAPPEDLYMRPRSLEVARFVGAPRINVVPGEILANGEIHCLAQRIAATPGNSGPCHVAFRPQAVTLARAPGLTVRGVVGHVEYAGTELMATLTLPSQGEACIVCLPAGTAARAGAEFEVTVPWEALHVFDAGGQRLSIDRCDVLARVA